MRINFIDKLIETTKLSCNIHKHAAVLLLNGKPIFYNFNSIIGNKSYHAEVAVINKYIRSCGFVNFNKCILWTKCKSQNT